MDEIIRVLKTPEECKQVEKIFSNLAQQAKLRAIELRALSHGSKQEVELELLKVLYAYEEVLTKKNKRKIHASRTWPMVHRYGIIKAAEKAVNRPTDALGYKILVEMGMQDLTFESVILRYPKAFDKKVVELARTRLEELRNIR
jgi:hypothetical protein